VNFRDCAVLDSCLAEDEVDDRMEEQRRGGGMIEQSQFEEVRRECRDSRDELRETSRKFSELSLL